ncbi:hypothetical protein I4U23_006109 [Adineta vaga]|nr:hypothetical protein I4U23_006109 [Adineta vaga]
MPTRTKTSVDLATNYLKFQTNDNFPSKISLTYLFLISLIGLITNISTIILISKNSVTKNLKIKWALIALALSDLVFNIALSVRGISDMIEGESERVCMFITFFGHLAELLSAYYTVSFTIQRYWAVRYPFEAAANRRSSPIIPLSFIFLLSSIFCFFFHYEENPSEKCRPVPALHWFIANALLSFVVPFFLILIFNILIVYYIRNYSSLPIGTESISLKQTKFTKTSSLDDVDLESNKTKESSSPLSCINTGTSTDRHRSRIFILSKGHFSKKTDYSSQTKDTELTSGISLRMSQSIRITRMLVFVSTCFLILNAPAHLCAIALKIYIEINSFIPPGSTLINLNQVKHNLILIPDTSNQTYHENILSVLQHSPIADDKSAYQQLYKAVLITQMIQYASYSINFFLYSLSGIAFRSNLKQVIQKL